MNDWWWLADKLAWYITWYKVAHFQLMGGYHVNLDMSYFKQTRIVIDTLQNHYRFILNTLPHLYYTGTTSLSRTYHFKLYMNSQNYYFVSVLVSSFQITLKSIIFCKNFDVMFSEKKYGISEFLEVPRDHHQKKCFKSWNDHNWFWSAR